MNTNEFIDFIPIFFEKLKEDLITHNQQVNPVIEIIFTHKCQEN